MKRLPQDTPYIGIGVKDSHASEGLDDFNGYSFLYVRLSGNGLFDSSGRPL